MDIKTLLSPSPAPRWAVHLPKAHLHVHLGGACPAWLWDHIAPDTPAKFSGDCRRDGFSPFDQHHHMVSETVKTRTSAHQLIRAIAWQAQSEGTRWVELQINPDKWADWADMDSLIDACAPRSHGTAVGIGIVILASRDQPTHALRLARTATQTPGVVGFGIAGDELANPIDRYADALRVAAAGGLKLVPHAGELTADTYDIETAVQLGVHRLAHGLSAATDPGLMDVLRTQGVCLDVAVASNWSMATVDRSSPHPLVSLVDAGVPCSINSDNPLLVGHDLAAEYELVRDALDVDVVAMARFAADSFIHSAAPDSIKSRALADIAAWVAKRQHAYVSA